ncbi:hypothetical protein GDO81_010178 [Engystomops pustulosus]|uniref:Uncharacterized protein n=1 Tax=Engystomops pustulosus TaxID=76066 RepID=A0AAV7BXH9_ENGPU|nr:hypothetical protein GDO81_010178 [Engystomops pustulosus]
MFFETSVNPQLESPLRCRWDSSYMVAAPDVKFYSSNDHQVICHMTTMCYWATHLCLQDFNCAIMLLNNRHLYTGLQPERHTATMHKTGIT